MKKIVLIVIVLSLVIVSSFTSYSQSIPEDSLYLSQTPPSNTPKLFPLSVSSGYFAAERIAVSPDGNEIYYTELNGYSTNSTNRIKYYSYSGGKWNGSQILFENFSSPALSIDGKTLYFGLHNVVSHSIRQDTGWSVPNSFLPNQPLQYLVQETNTGSYYCSSMYSNGCLGGKDWSKLIINGADTILQSLGLPLNTSNDDLDYFVSRDESFIILAAPPVANRTCYGQSDLYITYRKNNNTWTNPKNLGTKINVINSSDGRWAPYVTGDNKYMFYSSGWYSPSIYWVRIDNLIDSLKHTNFIPYLKNTIPNQTAIKDSLFSYQVPDTTFIDDDGNNTLRYTATLSNGNPLPAWLSLDSIKCVLSGTPDTLAQYNIKVTATDTVGASVSSAAFRITVTNPPSSVGEEKDRLQGFMLNQNYPNPFNPTTVISYRLPAYNNVKLTIYNLLGQKVKTLVNSFQSAGEHSIAWDATDGRNNPVSSGMYFYRLEAGTVNLQKKMLLIR